MKQLMTGNDAMAEAAIQAGCRYYFGYPITPQNEFTAYMARRMPQVGGVFIQSESEIAAINMVMGAAAAGGRAMTSSSSPGISLKQEGISYIAGDQLPAVILNVMRGGPGLGNIAPAQGDYFQATRGGGHGDYRCIVLAPSTVQEGTELIQDAFDLADKYRNPVLILSDGRMGQMMEPVEFKPRPKAEMPPKDYILTGKKGRERRIIRSLYLKEPELEAWNKIIQEKLMKIEENEVRYETRMVEDADLVLIGYGTCARNSKEAMRTLREKGRKVGVFRPITLWPFPYTALSEVVKKARAALVVEMSAGQMVEDVYLAVKDTRPIFFYGRMGGQVPSATEIVQKAEKIFTEKL
ncbi:MAG: 3-methyl-2-oxobutanoate dehydrogenase subunit beta [Planctomycetota bacterium]|nr:MAG: 3-methyl-2-oxobutanoate dehydrogenase subunit beta [Planctomycetota bacterium]